MAMQSSYSPLRGRHACRLARCVRPASRGLPGRGARRLCGSLPRVRPRRVVGSRFIGRVRRQAREEPPASALSELAPTRRRTGRTANAVLTVALLVYRVAGLERRRPRRVASVVASGVALALVGATLQAVDLVGAGAADAATSAGIFVPVATRLLDTRTSTALAANTPRLITVAGTSGVPSSGVAAVAISLSAVNFTTSGHMFAAAGGAANPGVTMLNYSASSPSPVSNSAVAAVNSSTGQIEVEEMRTTTPMIP